MHMIEVHNQEAEHSYKLGMNHRGDVGVLENDVSRFSCFSRNVRVLVIISVV